MGTKLRSLVVNIGADLTAFDKSMKKMSKDLGKVGKDFQTVGGGMTKGISVPILGAVAGLTGLAVKASNTADELLTLSAKTGISTKRLQELQYAARFIDVDIETMTGSMQKLTKSMDTARDGTGAQAEAFKSLGIAVTNSDGSLRDSKEVWAEAIDALGKVANETDRDALSMQLFGKSAAELNPLIKAGSDELKRLSTEANDVGAVMSDTDVNSLGKFNDTLEQLKAVLGNVAGEIGASFLPILETLKPILTDTIVPAIKQFAEFLGDIFKKFSELSPETQKFILAALGIAVAIGPVIGLIGKMISGIGGFAKILGILGPLITFPTGLIIAGLIALATVVFLVIKNWGKISEFFKGVWESIKKIFSVVGEWFGNIFTGAWDAIKKAFAAVGKFFSGIWGSIKSIFGDIGVAIGNAIGGAFKTVVNAIIGFAEFTINGFIKAINAAIKLINKIPFVNITEIKLLDIPRLNVGTNYVPHDMIAEIHKGEAVIPAKYNVNNGKGESFFNTKHNTTNGGSTIINFNSRAFEGAIIMDDYGVDRLMDRIRSRLVLSSAKI